MKDFSERINAGLKEIMEDQKIGGTVTIDMLINVLLAIRDYEEVND